MQEIQDKQIIVQRTIKEEEMEIMQAYLNMVQAALKKIKNKKETSKVLKVHQELVIVKKVVAAITEKKLLVTVGLVEKIQSVEMKTSVVSLQIGEKEVLTLVQILMKTRADPLHLTEREEIQRNLGEKRDSHHITMVLELNNSFIISYHFLLFTQK